MLTADKLALLAKPFAANEHGWLDGNPYIQKSAIRDRLNQVDHAWSSGPPEYVVTDGDVVFYRMSLTICGVARHGLGSGVIRRTNKSGEALTGFTAAREVAKAHKQAERDCLPRAAGAFNVGAYLRDQKPQSWNQAKFGEWLAGLPVPHWSHNGGRDRVSAVMAGLELKWDAIKAEIEPGRTLAGLSATTLSETDFILRLVALSLPKAAPAPALATIAIAGVDITSGDELQLNRPGHRFRIASIGPVEVDKERGAYRVAEGEWEDGLAEMRQFSNFDLSDFVLIGGPKLEAARANPALLKKAGPGYRWIGEPAATR